MLAKADPVLAWRAFAAFAAAVSLGGRYHQELGLADCGLALARRGGVDGWRTALQAAPTSPVCHYGLSTALRGVGRLDDAHAIMAGALARFPNDLGTLIESARVAELRGDYEDAHAYWSKAAARPLPRPLWLAGAAHALLTLGRYDEAETVLTAARTRHPRHRGLMAVECMLASARENWPRAIELWSAFYRRYPDYPNAWEFLGRAVHAAKMSEVDATAHIVTKAAERADVALVKDAATRDLLLRFESIGENCEFGLVQRRYGAEPFGLFRWNIVWVECLVAALEHGLDGIGAPEHTEMVVLSNKEFFVQDRRWYLGRHTFKYEGQIAHEELFPAMCAMTASLRTRFLEALADARRIFVYASDGLTQDELDRLHAALGRHGPNRLVAVQPAEPTNASPFRGRPGEVRRVGPGRYVGFLARRGINPDTTWSIAWDDWIAICRMTAEMEAA